MALMYLYMQVHNQKKALCRRHFHSIGSKLSQECRAIFSKKSLRASLGLSPRRTDLIQQVTTLDCNLYGEATTVFPIRNLLDPPIGQHDPEISGQRGGIEVQTLPNLDTPNRARLCHKNQKIQLACFQAEWAEFSIVDAREHTIKFAGARQQALTCNLIKDIFTPTHPRFGFHFCHTIMLHIQ